MATKEPRYDRYQSPGVLCFEIFLLDNNLVRFHFFCIFAPKN